jgi:hypothetical protein
MSNIGLNQVTGLYDDKQYVACDQIQNDKYSSFNIENHLCEHKNSLVDINKDSELKLGGNKLTSDKMKCGKLLQARPYATTPYMGSGKTCILNADVESHLKMGEDTGTPKSINTLSGITINRFIPLIQCIEQNIQDPIHIIPDKWVRGGADTRSTIRNIDYRKQCLNF